MQQYRAQVDRRRRNIRLMLGAIIALTLPFYCAGVILWGTAPQKNVRPTTLPAATTPFIPPTVGLASATPATTATPQPGITLLPVTIVVPTAVLPTLVQPTRYLSPTPTFVIPTALPTNPPPLPPTETPVPLPTEVMPP